MLAASVQVVDGLRDAASRAEKVVDTRPLEACLVASVEGARCLPATDFVDPTGNLANFRDIRWLLGAAGLSGRESILVAGDDEVRREFVAGVLFLAGQARVTIVTRELAAILRTRPRLRGSGVARGLVRRPIYEAPLRDARIVLASELVLGLESGAMATLLPQRQPAVEAPPRWLIVNAESRSRGERLPGLAFESAAVQVVLAATPLESIAAFARLSTPAETGLFVYPRGWQDPRLRYHFESAARVGAARKVPDGGRSQRPGDERNWPVIGIVLLAVAAVVAVVGLVVGRRRPWN